MAPGRFTSTTLVVLSLVSVCYSVYPNTTLLSHYENTIDIPLEDVQELLDAHNYYRSLVARTQNATNMRIMNWNRNLANFARNWLETCQEYHTPDAPRSQLEGYNYAGENIVGWGNAPYTRINLTDAVHDFYWEEAYYHYGNNTCDREECTHYTQLVWANTYQVGCGVTKPGRCRSRILMCNYAPGGNYVGERPFSKGTPCGGCSNEWSYCINGLCSRTPEPPAVQISSSSSSNN